MSRRTILKGIGVGAGTLSSGGPVTAGSGTKYVLTTRGTRVRDRIERGDFRVIRKLVGRCFGCHRNEFGRRTRRYEWCRNGGLYYFSGGTSAADSQVTGTVALIGEFVPDASSRQVEQGIKHGADLVEGQNDPKLRAGRLLAADPVTAPTIND